MQTGGRGAESICLMWTRPHLSSQKRKNPLQNDLLYMQLHVQAVRRCQDTSANRKPEKKSRKVLEWMEKRLNNNSNVTSEYHTRNIKLWKHARKCHLTPLHWQSRCKCIRAHIRGPARKVQTSTILVPFRLYLPLLHKRTSQVNDVAEKRRTMSFLSTHKE